MGTITYPSGHFAAHNAKVLDSIAKTTSIKESVKLYVKNAIADGLALIDAGASNEQIKSSLQALGDQFETKAWPAIVQSTKYKDVE